MKTINQVEVGAWICTAKNRKRVYKIDSKNGVRKSVYLNDGDTFEIELYNPTTNNVKIDIEIDNKKATGLGGVVVRKGERVYLDCFIDTLNKFTYRTYFVGDNESSINAIKDNGKILINVYNETIAMNGTGTITYGNNYYKNIGTYTTWASTNTNGDTITWGTNNTTLNTNNYYANTTGDVKVDTLANKESIYNTKKSRKTIETGQVEQGVKSDTVFDTYFGNFSPVSCNSFIYYLLPESTRPVDVKEIKKKQNKKEMEDNLYKAELNRNAISNLSKNLFDLEALRDRNLISKEIFEKLRDKLLEDVSLA